MLWLIPLFPLLGAILIPFMTALRGEPMSRRGAGGLASLMVLASAVLSSAVVIQMIQAGGDPLEQVLYTWIEAGTLRADVGFFIDPLAGVMINVITWVGFLIHVYSVGYMSDDVDSGRVWRYFTYLNLFVFSMLILVLADNFLLMFVGWEGVGLCSYLLIGFWYEKVDFAKAGMKAFVTNRVGDFSFILGMFLLFWSLGDQATVNFAALREVVASSPELVGGFGGAVVTGVCLLLFGGATGKSAQIPLFVWLPDAMAGPTPVSALIHAATMVTSGIYMICRLNFLFAMSPVALGVIAVIGATTALFAATIAVTQNDIKKVLAYSTVSQLGYMFLGVGVGAFSAGFFHVVTHAFFKALLFLGSGSIIYALHHEQDMRKMGGLRKFMPITYGTFALAYLAIIGVPGFSGFFSKDEVLWLAASVPPDRIGHWVLPALLWIVGTVTAGLTAFYMTRLMIMTFFGEYRGDDHGHGPPQESPQVITMPLIVLAVLSVGAGLFNLPHWAHEIPFIGHILPIGSLEHFLAPVFADAHATFATHSPVEGHASLATEMKFMGGTLAAVIGGVWLARFLYYTEPSWREELKRDFHGLYEGSQNKWYIDELYQMAIIGPILFASRNLLHAVLDVHVIDGAVNGLAAAFKGVGRWMGRTVQGGLVQGYALAVAAGAAVLVLVYAVGV